jgi:hypothetical protein
MHDALTDLTIAKLTLWIYIYTERDVTMALAAKLPFALAFGVVSLHCMLDRLLVSRHDHPIHVFSFFAITSG